MTSRLQASQDLPEAKLRELSPAAPAPGAGWLAGVGVPTSQSPHLSPPPPHFKDTLRINMNKASVVATTLTLQLRNTLVASRFQLQPRASLCKREGWGGGVEGRGSGALGVEEERLLSGEKQAHKAPTRPDGLQESLSSSERMNISFTSIIFIS